MWLTFNNWAFQVGESWLDSTCHNMYTCQASGGKDKRELGCTVYASCLTDSITGTVHGCECDDGYYGNAYKYCRPYGCERIAPGTRELYLVRNTVHPNTNVLWHLQAYYWLLQWNVREIFGSLWLPFKLCYQSNSMELNTANRRYELCLTWRNLHYDPMSY